MLEDGDIITDGTNWYRYTIDRGIECLDSTAMAMYNTAGYMIESTIYFAKENAPKVLVAIEATANYVRECIENTASYVCEKIETHGPKVVEGIKYTVKEGGEIAIQILKVK